MGWSVKFYILITPARCEMVCYHGNTVAQCAGGACLEVLIASATTSNSSHL